MVGWSCTAGGGWGEGGGGDLLKLSKCHAGIGYWSHRNPFGLSHSYWENLIVSVGGKTVRSWGGRTHNLKNLLSLAVGLWEMSGPGLRKASRRGSGCCQVALVGFGLFLLVGKFTVFGRCLLAGQPFCLPVPSTIHKIMAPKALKFGTKEHSLRTSRYCRRAPRPGHPLPCCPRASKTPPDGNRKATSRFGPRL